MKKLIVNLFFTYLLVGCATAVHKDWVAVGGSKSDGIVKLAYETGAFEKPILNGSQAISEAKARCIAWGYKDVEPFSGSLRQCNQFDPYLGCIRSTTTKEFQCLNSDSSEPS